MRVPNENPDKEIRENILMIVICVLLFILAFEIMIVFDIPLFRGTSSNYFSRMK